MAHYFHKYLNNRMVDGFSCQLTTASQPTGQDDEQRCMSFILVLVTVSKLLYGIGVK